MPRRLREPQLNKHLQHGNFPRLALRLAGLQVHQRPRTGSPGKAFTPRPGKKYTCSPWPNFRLQVHQRPRTGSPGKAFTPRPGKKSTCSP
ncbi:hypothetical protein FMJ13_09485 [Klebsiella michiganensis]|nr:hypothetical protein [Klebsiella michiganensis]